VIARPRRSWGEDALQIVGRDADAGIADRDVGDLAAVADRNGDAAGLRVFDRVRDEVDQDLPQAFLVGLDLVGQPILEFELQLKALGGGLRPEHVDDVVEQAANVDDVRPDRQDAALDPRNLEQAFDQVGDVFGRAADDLARLSARHRVVALEQLRIAVDDVQRRADLVADRHEIARLRFVRGFGARLRALKLGQGILWDHEPPGRDSVSI
jgi:hypothetical protein